MELWITLLPLNILVYYSIKLCKKIKRGRHPDPHPIHTRHTYGPTRWTLLRSACVSSIAKINRYSARIVSRPPHLYVLQVASPAILDQAIRVPVRAAELAEEDAVGGVGDDRCSRVPGVQVYLGLWHGHHVHPNIAIGQRCRDRLVDLLTLVKRPIDHYVRIDVFRLPAYDLAEDVLQQIELHVVGVGRLPRLPAVYYEDHVRHARLPLDQ